MEVSTGVYVALGAVLAALVAGFFSFINLVSSKENKVSEFRQAWIDGLRNDISEFTSAVHELVRFINHRGSIGDGEWLRLTTDAYTKARMNLARIQLRLNPAHLQSLPDGLDATLMKSVKSAQDAFNQGDYVAVVDRVEQVRNSAAPLLKSEWERVKLGEKNYRRVRTIAWAAILLGVILLAACAGFLVFLPNVPDSQPTARPPTTMIPS